MPLSDTSSVYLIIHLSLFGITLADAQATDHVGWYSTANTRGTLDILWTCIFTIFVCCWTAIHPDIPPPGMTWKQQYIDRALCFIIGLISPEIFIYFAFYERYTAVNLLDDRPQDVDEEYWSVVHRFYANMGGFCIRWQQSSDPNDTDVGNLTSDAAYELLEKRILPLDRWPTAKEIADKGKADGVAKILAVSQILWVLIQSIARGVQHLPLTTLEITTLAYIPCACFIYFLWWHKPYDVQIPTVFDISTFQIRHDQSTIAEPNTLLDTRHPIHSVRLDGYPMTRNCWSAIKTAFVPINRNGTLSATVFLVVGSIHLSAWNISFPSRFETWAWRICALIITVSIPISWLVSRVVTSTLRFLGMKVVPRVWRYNVKEPQSVWESGDYTTSDWVAMCIQGFGVGLYALARLYLLVEVFVALRSVPEGVYETPDWTQFIPRVS